MRTLPKTESACFEQIGGKLVFFPLGPLMKGHVVPNKKAKKRILIAYAAMIFVFGALILPVQFADDGIISFLAACFASTCFVLVRAFTTRGLEKYPNRQSWLSFVVQQARGVSFSGVVLATSVTSIGGVFVTGKILLDLLDGDFVFELWIVTVGLWIVVGWGITLIRTHSRVERLEKALQKREESDE